MKIRLFQSRRDRKSLKRRSATFGPVVAGFLVVMLVGEVAIGDKGISAIAAAVRDPASLFSERSPGVRAPGAKFQTKPGHVPSAYSAFADPARPAVPPAAGTSEPEPSAFAAMTPETPAETIPVPGPFSEAVPPAGIPGPFFAPPSNPFIPPVGIPGGGGGGGGNAPDPTTPTTPTDPTNPPVTPPTGAVPEPATWAMLVLGFFSVGSIMRRQRRLQSAALASGAIAR